MGFVQYPEQSDCDGQYPTNARVCRCTSSVSPAPGPPPVVYSTLVWTYEWDTAAVAAAAEAPVPSESDGLAATLKVRDPQIQSNDPSLVLPLCWIGHFYGCAHTIHVPQTQAVSAQLIRATIVCRPPRWWRNLAMLAS